MVINILHSIGDIIFCEPIYRHFWKVDGKKPTVIIRDHLIWLQDYIESAKFLRESQYAGSIDNMKKTDTYLPLRFANQYLRGHDRFYHGDFENCMPDKYMMAGMNPDLWLGLQIQFDIEKAKGLFAALDLSSEDDYIVVNKHCQAGWVDIKPETNYRVVEMYEVPGFNVCDWAMIMLLAKENHHVSTSTFFILQALTDYKGKIFIYPRPNEDGLRGISKLNTNVPYTSMP